MRYAGFFGKRTKYLAGNGDFLKRWPSVPFACTTLFTLVLSVWLGKRFFFNFNPDSLALLQLARYWWNGQWSLAASSYWGPLLPILLSPLAGIGFDPFLAGRVAMTGSTLLYLVGARTLLKSLGLSSTPLEGCTFLTGVTVALFSAMAPTADLLMSGLVCFGLSQILSMNWENSRARQMAAGGLLGLAYLAKAVALPLALLLIFTTGMLRLRPVIGNYKKIASAFTVTVLALVLIAGPWIAAMSFKFNTFMFSSSGSLNHAIAGPTDIDRYHPVGRTFHSPADGRMFAWEDPYGMAYHHWSAFEKPEYFQHQLSLVANNAKFIFEALGGGLLGLALTALLLAKPWHLQQTNHWTLAFPFVVLMSCLYLPVFAGSTRYYLMCFPVLFASAAMVLMELVSRVGLKARLGLPLVALSTGLLAVHYQIRPTWRELHVVDTDYGFAVRQALPLANTLVNTGRSIEVASIGDDYRVGLFLAFAMNTRWRGNHQNPTLNEVKQSGAQLIVIANTHPLLLKIIDDPDMREQIAPTNLNGVKSKTGNMRYYWYKRSTD